MESIRKRKVGLVEEVVNPIVCLFFIFYFAKIMKYLMKLGRKIAITFCPKRMPDIEKQQNADWVHTGMSQSQIVYLSLQSHES